MQRADLNLRASVEHLSFGCKNSEIIFGSLNHYDTELQSIRLGHLSNPNSIRTQLWQFFLPPDQPNDRHHLAQLPEPFCRKIKQLHIDSPSLIISKFSSLTTIFVQAKLISNDLLELAQSLHHLRQLQFVGLAIDSLAPNPRAAMNPVLNRKAFPRLPWVQMLKVYIRCESHLDIAANIPLSRVFPRIQSLQLVYTNVGCTECGYSHLQQFFNDFKVDDRVTFAVDCVRGLLNSFRPQWQQLKIGYVTTSLPTKDGVRE